MKSKLMLAVLVSIASTHLITADDSNSSFEQGMLEEEANHNLDAAIRKYRESLSLLITNRGGTGKMRPRPTDVASGAALNDFHPFGMAVPAGCASAPDLASGACVQSDA
jgi:hypothetical protein